LRERVIALAAAYAIALASLIASFGAAQAAAEATAAGPDGGTGIICHSDTGERTPASGSHESNGAICFKCFGCVTSSLTTIIPPAVPAAGPRQLSFKRLDLPALLVRLAGTRSNAHRSRGPPQAS
jgi:hypothetical protein